MIASLLTVAVLVVAGCSSSSSTGGTPSPAAPSTPSTTAPSSAPVPVGTPSTADTPTPLVLPDPTSTAVNRKVTRPAGASMVPLSVCNDGADFVAEFLKVGVFQATDPTIQKSNFAGSASLATKELVKFRSSRSALLAAGYPAHYVLLEDMKNEAAALDDLLGAIKSNDISRLPKIFLELSSAGDQFVRDSGPACG